MLLRVASGDSKRGGLDGREEEMTWGRGEERGSDCIKGARDSLGRERM